VWGGGVGVGVDVDVDVAERGGLAPVLLARVGFGGKRKRTRKEQKRNRMRRLCFEMLTCALVMRFALHIVCAPAAHTKFNIASKAVSLGEKKCSQCMYLARFVNSIRVSVSR
jgi:hypothetical protein